MEKSVFVFSEGPSEIASLPPRGSGKVPPQTSLVVFHQLCYYVVVVVVVFSHLLVSHNHINVNI